ncbi:hypothetical protein B296_00025643, partial [Ensete ventricosum]
GRDSEGDAGVDVESGVEKKAEEGDHPMDGGDAPPPPPPATVFRIRLKQPPSSLRHKMSVPELCRNFSYSAIGLLAVIYFSSTTNPPFWIPIHIINPERPTECAVFNVKAENHCTFTQGLQYRWVPPNTGRYLQLGCFRWYQSREKEEEGELGDLASLSLNDPNPSLAGRRSLGEVSRENKLR